MGTVSHDVAGTRCTALQPTSAIWVIEGGSYVGPTLPLIRRSIFFYDWRDRTLPSVLDDLHHAPVKTRVDVNIQDRTPGTPTIRPTAVRNATPCHNSSGFLASPYAS